MSLTVSIAKYQVLAEFTAIEDWEREYSVFHKIQRIPFIARFRLFKNFVVWKTNIRNGKIFVSSERLGKNLFILNQRLSKTLLQVRDLCSNISLQYLYFISNQETFSLEGFRQVQEKHWERIQGKISCFSDETRACVRNACDKVRVP